MSFFRAFPMRLGICVVAVVAMLTTLAGASPALAESPWWHVTSNSRPTNLPPGGKGTIAVIAENLGDANVTGSTSPVQITAALPPTLKAVAIAGAIPAGNSQTPLPCSLVSLTCTLAGTLPPYGQVEVRIAVVVQGFSSGEETVASVSGGEGSSCTGVGVGTGNFKDIFCRESAVGGGFEAASTGPIPGASIKRPVTVSGEPTLFGVEDYELANEEEGGAPATQAGSHPFQQTTTLNLKQTADANPPPSEEKGGKPEVNPAAPVKDLNIKWPPGLIGNPTTFPRCSLGQFLTRVEGIENACSPQTAVGVAAVSVFEPALVGMLTLTVPLFNLEPAVGEPARFGFFVIEGNAPVIIDTSVRTGGDYGVTVSIHNVTQTAAFLSSEVTVWGVPGDRRHDNARGWGCLAAARGAEFHAPCNASEAAHPTPFLSLPTSCTGPLQSTVEGDSWLQKGSIVPLASAPMPSLAGCNRLPFSASIMVAPDGQAGSTPTGLTVDVHVPQDQSLNPKGLTGSDVKDITATLPEGVTLNPAAADGLQACSESQIGYLRGESAPPRSLHFSPNLPSPFCPDAAKVGTVKIKTPLLPNPLEGAVYLASPQNFGAPLQENPFESLIAMYIVATDPASGTLVKIPGRVSLNQTTGQIVSTFENNPQLPFEDAELHFFGGDRAPLATPAPCGTYTTNAVFSPWSGNPPITSQSSFDIISGTHGAACPSPQPFAPSLAAGMTNIQAGAFSPNTTSISREDGNQDIQAVTLQMPPGLSGLLSSVKLCGEEQANAGTCGPESLIGHTVVSVGLGADPFSVTGGQVFITGPYKGGPFGLSIVNPAKAGPFDLGKVVVRAKIEVDRHTAQITVTTDSSGSYAIPHILDGIPLQIKRVNVTIDRPGFTFNGTSCNPMAITGNIGSVDGASAPVSVPFQIANCATLKFTPKISVSTAAHSSKAAGASLFFKITYPSGAIGTQSWFNEAKFDIPKQLPARLTTIQKACLASVFEANPAACPVGSLIGQAVVHTQVLPVPLEGPVYFVSYGSAKFPDAVLVLQGDGVTVDLRGETFIRKGVTSATFRNTPDVPFESIEVTVPGGPFSEFAANLPASAKGSFCAQKLAIPTLFKAQNGLEIHRSTRIGVTGCPKAKKATRAQKLARALKECPNTRNHSRWAACVRQARKRYAAKK